MLDRHNGRLGYFGPQDCDLEAFQALTSRTLLAADVPHAMSVEQNIPLYDVAALPLEVGPERQALLSEWAWVLGQSAGVIVLKRAYSDMSAIDRATHVFQRIIEDERSRGAGKGDHFAASGANDRVWNALQKQCEHDPEGFALYFGNVAIAAVCQAWLGPNYQMTAQVNQVRPSGKAQTCHRDYHLGFQSAEAAGRFPAHVHALSATLTLQGAVAHCDMPVESGPTKLLPFSQLYGPGYLAFHQDDHRAWFEEAHVQLPLEKGDVVFFNPAVFHAAGENRSRDINRLVNLLQVSSAFGRAMEAVDRTAMCKLMLPVLQSLKASGTLSEAEQTAAIAATAEGYAFPTNLDTDPPIGGTAPPSQADLLVQALEDGASVDAFAASLDARTARRRP